MGLLTNGYRDKIGVFKTYGGSFHNNSFPQGARNNYNLTGAKRNITAGEGITDEKVGIPMGYAGKSWQLPQKAGFVSSRDAALAVVCTGTMLMGYPIDGSASMSFAVADADGQLISSGSGSASLAFAAADALLTASLGGAGSASFEVSTNTPLLGAEASLTGTAGLVINGSLTPYAIGIMSGSTEVVSDIVNANIVSVNGYFVTGDGQSGSEWGPV